MKSTKCEYNKIHCLGGALADLILNRIDNYPKPKITTSIFVDDLTYSAGGGAVNSSQALAKLGLTVNLFSRVGNDPFGDMVKGLLTQGGVGIEYLSTSEHKHTSTVIVGVHEDADRSFISYHGALSEYSMKNLSEDVLLDCTHLLCPDLFNLPQIDGEPLAGLFRKAKEKGIETFLDATWGISGLRKDILEVVLPHIDFFLPSADECRLMYPGKSDYQLIDHLLGKGAGTVVLKRGSLGVLGSDGTKVYEYPAIKNESEIVDTTGAGDSFNAGFIYGSVHGYDLENCLKAGSIVAGYSLMGSGSWYSREGILKELSEGFSV